MKLRPEEKVQHSESLGGGWVRAGRTVGYRVFVVGGEPSV